MLKNMKKIVSVVWAIILVISFSNLTLMAKEDSLSFVELEEKEGVEILAELENAGLKLPEAYQQDRILAASSVKMILSDMKAGKLNDIIPYNYTELVELAKEVGHIANDYGKTFVARASALQDSTLYGTWSDSYLNYNCYGHAIGKHVFKNPGYYSGQKFSMSLSIQSMAKLVVDDLASLGYTSYYKTTKPSTLKSYEKVIAIRKGTADYHFMKGQTTTNWTHKPGNTNILKWNYTSPNQKIWTNECVFKGTYYSSDTTYNSTIYYIIYWPKDVGPQPDSISLEDIYEKNNKVLIGIVVFGLAVLFAIWGFNKINRNSDNKIVENEKWSKVELIKLSYSHVGNISPNDYKKLYELLSDAAKNEVQSDKVECVDFDIKIYTEDAEKPAIEIFVQKDGIVELKESGKCFKGSKELIEFLANAYE